ncbi:MAG TPA: Rid family detoxifying hydrolase [Candidatus Limnocylindrales bacterium]|nr:Rid family detoxifying hydrolase [Candidatus Limnocylindrales bacterium]
MTVRAIKPSGAPGALASYSPAIDTGSFVFLAGQIGLDPQTGELVDGGVEAQTERALRNVVAVLDAAGLTMADVVKTTCFLADIGDFDAFNSVYARFVGDPPPARSTFAVAALPRGARVEVEAVAFRSSNG